jgi:starch phosphorylase
MQLIESIAGSVGGYIYQVDMPATHPANQFTARIVPSHSAARVPMEANLILWQR